MNESKRINFVDVYPLLQLRVENLLWDHYFLVVPTSDTIPSGKLTNNQLFMVNDDGYIVKYAASASEDDEHWYEIKDSPDLLVIMSRFLRLGYKFTRCLLRGEFIDRDVFVDKSVSSFWKENPDLKNKWRHLENRYGSDATNYCFSLMFFTGKDFAYDVQHVLFMRN